MATSVSISAFSTDAQRLLAAQREALTEHLEYLAAILRSDLRPSAEDHALACARHWARIAAYNDVLQSLGH